MQQSPLGVCHLFGCFLEQPLCFPLSEAQCCTLSEFASGPLTKAGAEAPSCCAATMLACLFLAYHVASPHVKPSAAHGHLCRAAAEAAAEAGASGQDAGSMPTYSQLVQQARDAASGSDAEALLVSHSLRLLPQD